MIIVMEKMTDQLDCCNPGKKPLSPARRQILDMIRQSPTPIGAYAILDLYKKNHPTAAPPTIYRALEYLCKNNWVHRIEKLNAYIACDHAHHHGNVQFLICSRCGVTREIQATDIGKTTKNLANKVGFIVEQTIVEIIGHCKDCA
jgi:Fur family zinc uptake transcriptional regulator